MCSPRAAISASLGEAMSTRLVKTKSVNCALPTPPPPPEPMLPELEAPQLMDVISISSLWALSVDSPLIPSSLRNASTCDMVDPPDHFEGKLGSGPAQHADVGC